MKRKIYVWCSLTFASDAYRKTIEDFKNKLRKKYELLDFIGLGNGSAPEVYEYDRNCVLGSDILIAECSYPSTGLWYEIATAIEHHKTVFLIAHKDAVVTRMILWIPEEKAMFIRYESLDEIIEYIEKNDTTG